MLNIFFWHVIFRQAHDRKITFSFNIERNNRISLFYGNYGNHARLTALSQCTVVSHVHKIIKMVTSFLYSLISSLLFILVCHVLYREIPPAILYVYTVQTSDFDANIWQKSDRLFCSSLTLTWSYGPWKQGALVHKTTTLFDVWWLFWAPMALA
jgi:hypothetical protein